LSLDDEALLHDPGARIISDRI